MAERLTIIVSMQNAAKGVLNDLKGGFAALRSEGTKTKTVFKGFYSQLLKFAGAAGIFAVIKSSIGVFKEFDDTMRQVGAVTGATGKEFDLLTKTAQKMGRDTRYSAAQAAEGLKLLGMAGFDAEEASKALPGVLNLAAAGSLDLGTAADIATNVLAGFGLEVEKLSQVNDVLVKTFTGSNTTLSELGEGFKLVGPIAKGVGEDFEDLVGALGKLGDAGLKGTLAGTALRGSINALLNPTKEEEGLMKNLSKRIGGVGLILKDANGDFIGFTKLIQQLEKAGLKGDEALKLFGLRAGPGMAALLQVGSEKLSQFTEELRNATGTAKEISYQMEAGIGGASRRAAAAFESLRITAAKTFEKQLINSINDVKDSLNDISETLKELDRDHTLSKLGSAIKFVFRGLGPADVLSAAWLDIKAIAGVAHDLIADIDKDGSKIDRAIDNLQKRFIQGSELYRKILQGSLDREIEATNKEIANQKRLIEQDKESIDGWRAKLVGAKVYQEQLEKHEKQLVVLQNKINELNNKKLLITAISFDDRKNAEALQSEFAAINEDIESGSGPIGKGAKKVGDAITNALINNEQMAVKLKASFALLDQQLKTEESRIAGTYAQGKITLENYYSEREAIVRKRIESELKYLRAEANDITDPKKLEEANARIAVKAEELNTLLARLDNERLADIERRNQQEQRLQDKLDSAKIAAAKAIADQQARLAVAGQGTGLQGKFQKELADLQSRQNAELDKIRDFYSVQLEILRDHHAKKEELEKLFAQRESAIQSQELNQQKEKAALIQEQARKAAEKNIENISSVFGGISGIFDQLYEAGGKKQKEFFQLSKAAAIAEASINLALAVSKVLSQEGSFGWGDAGAIAAKITALIAAISSQNLAEGGLVKGHSAHSKADDKLIGATSGEFMEPVAAVRHFGIDAMEVIRQRLVPRDVLRNALGLNGRFSMPNIRYGLSHFAEGGAIGSQSGMNPTNIKVEIINRSGDRVTAEQKDTRYDSQLRQYIISVMLDANARNVMGTRNSLNNR